MQVLRCIVGLCVVLLAVSCTETKKERFTRLVGEWNGKEIRFPARSVFTIQGQDTVDFHFQDAEYKVLTYIDSVGCTSCKLHLDRWKALIEETDSLTDRGVPFLFYLHPKNMQELRFFTRREGFTYPVCFDEQDELNRLNQFPTDVMFQTLLLNRENKVVAIGNPIHSPKLKELYLSVITGKSNAQPTTTHTSVSVNQSTLDFGRFPKTEEQEGSFVLTNTGNKLLVVHDITTSCGCTRVEYGKEPVRPGGTLEVKVIYEAEEAGHFYKTIKVYCNADSSPLRLAVKGTAE